MHVYQREAWLSVRPTACYQKQHDDNTFVHWRSHTPSILRLLHRCRGSGHRLPRNHLLLGMFLLHQAAGTADTRGWVAARQGTHAKTSHASHAELAGAEEAGHAGVETTRSLLSHAPSHAANA